MAQLVHQLQYTETIDDNKKLALINPMLHPVTNQRVVCDNTPPRITPITLSDLQEILGK